MKQILTGLAIAVLAVGTAHAQASNDPPPAGNVIGQLTGLPITSTPTTYTTSFIAGQALTNFAIAIREDPAFIEISNVVVADSLTPSVNLLTNGDFSGPTYVDPIYGTTQPSGWSYINVYNAGASGVAATNCNPLGTAACYSDGSVQAYDAINQLIPTVIGDTYIVSFLYADTAPVGTYQPLSTNGNITDTGGDGRDLFVYAAASVITAAPEPASMVLVASGIAGLGLLRRRRRG